MADRPSLAERDSPPGLSPRPFPAPGLRFRTAKTSRVHRRFLRSPGKEVKAVSSPPRENRSKGLLPDRLTPSRPLLGEDSRDLPEQPVPHLIKTLRLSLPYDPATSLSTLQVGRGDPSLRLRGGEVLWAMRTPAGPSTLHLRRLDDSIEAQAWGDGASYTLDTLEWRIGLADTSPEDFRPPGAPLRRMALRAAGLRFPRHPSVFCSLQRWVLAQKVTGIEAGQAYRRLVRSWGEPAPGPGGLFLPPTPEEILQHGYEEFHPLGVEKRRADQLRHLASRTRRLEALGDLEPEKAGELLCAQRGVGPWTSAKIVRQCLGDPDAVEVGDYNTPHMVAFNLCGEERSNDARMLDLLEPYRGYRGRAILLMERYGRHPPRRGPRADLRHLASR